MADHDAQAAFVAARYRDLGYTLGWSYLYTPRASLSACRALTVGLNPGGREDGGAQWSQEGGNAYRGERWHGAGAAMQRQMEALLDLLPYPEHEIASLQFVPFRSPSWATLARRDEAIAVGDRLFRWVLEQAAPELIVAVGRAVLGTRLPHLLGAAREPAGDVDLHWGEQRGECWRFGRGARLVVLPHLSRYRIFGRGHDGALAAALFGTGR